MLLSSPIDRAISQDFIPIRAIALCLLHRLSLPFVILQGKGTWKTYWLISAVKRPSIKVRDKQHLHPNGQPLMNYLNAPGHHFGSNSSLNIKRTDSLRRSMKGNSPALIKKTWHNKTDDESAALLNQTTVWWPVRVFAQMMSDFLDCFN